MDGPRIVAIGVASEPRAPLRAVESADLVPGHGIRGDRYAEGRGTFQTFPDHEITLVESETAEALGLPSPLLLRRNLATRGVRLRDLIGRTFTVGEARLEGVRSCDPCGHLERLLGEDGLKERIGPRGGLRARVVSGGRVRVGDPIAPS